jgi:hypothetical protein
MVKTLAWIAVRPNRRRISQRQACKVRAKGAAPRTVPSDWGHSSVGRALEWHSRGQGFDSPWLHHHGTRSGRTEPCGVTRHHVNPLRYRQHIVSATHRTISKICRSPQLTPRLGPPLQHYYSPRSWTYSGPAKPNHRQEIFLLTSRARLLRQAMPVRGRRRRARFAERHLQCHQGKNSRRSAGYRATLRQG